MKKVRLHHALKLLTVLTAFAFFAYYQSNFDPSFYAYILAVLISLIVSFFVWFESVYCENLFLNSKKDISRFSFGISFVMLFFVFCFSFFGMYMVANPLHYLIGKDVAYSHGAKLIGHTGMRRSGCSHTLLIIDSRDHVCLPESEYLSLKKRTIIEKKENIEVSLIYKVSFLGKDYIKMDLN